MRSKWRRKTVAGSLPKSPSRLWPIRRFICRWRRGSLGSPRFGARVGLFPSSRPATVLAVLPSLAKVSLCESSFRSATPPRSSFTSKRRSLRLSTRAAPIRGFGPHHDITHLRPHSRGIPTPRFVPSSGDRSLATVFSANGLAGLFHPAAVLRTHPVQGIILSAQPYYLVDSLSIAPLPLTPFC